MHISENQGSNLAPSPEEKVWLHIQKNIFIQNWPWGKKIVMGGQVPVGGS